MGLVKSSCAESAQVCAAATQGMTKLGHERAAVVPLTREWAEHWGVGTLECTLTGSSNAKSLACLVRTSSAQAEAPFHS